MTKTKLYVLLFDNYVFEGVFATHGLASCCRQTNMEHVREVIVEGDIINNKVYVVTDNAHCFRWAFANEEQAFDICNYHKNMFYKKKNIISHSPVGIIKIGESK